MGENLDNTRSFLTYMGKAADKLLVFQTRL